MTKHLTLLVHRIFPILLFIGSAWGQSNLSIKEEAVLDAKGDAKKWLAYPPLALISAGGLGTATFFVGEDIFDMSDELAFLPSIFAGSFGAVISYNLFGEKNKKGINGTSDTDNELYEKIYSSEFKKKEV